MKESNVEENLRVMSIDNEQLVFAEGNNGMASTETVAVATMSNNTKRIIVVDDSNQVCSIDDNDQLVPVTVGSYSGPLRRDDVDQSGNETITVADLQAAGLNVIVNAVSSATVTSVSYNGETWQKGQVANGDGVVQPLVVTGSNLSPSNAFVLNVATQEKDSSVIYDGGTSVTWNDPQDAGVWQLFVNGELWLTIGLV